ncbi:MAG TPA: 3-dehydroquinate synthase [Thermoanaerobaculia bacterium]|jgi:3-dehydroquinate synthase
MITNDDSQFRGWETATLLARFSVPYEYSVHFTSGIFERGNPVLRDAVLRGGQSEPVLCLVFLDDGVAGAWPDLKESVSAYGRAHQDVIRMAGNVVLVPGGERAKQDRAVVDSVVSAVNEHHLCRHSFVIAIGGGAVLDAVGFGAAISHRGIRLIRIPTTTLSQCDAGVGVKNGIDAFGKKNFVGSFAPPWAVINDTSLLCSLTDRDWRSGIAEAVKVSLLKDATFFGEIEIAAPRLRTRDESALVPILRRSAELHLQHIAQGGDAFERRSARPLDFGHWTAHKLEEASGFRLPHGEAVAIGVALDTILSVNLGHLSRLEAHRILQCLVDLGLPIYHMLLEDISRLAQGIEEFRQHLGGTLVLTQLKGIGEPVEVHTLGVESIRLAVSDLASYIPGRNSSSRIDDPSDAPSLQQHSV